LQTLYHIIFLTSTPKKNFSEKIHTQKANVLSISTPVILSEHSESKNLRSIHIPVQAFCAKILRFRSFVTALRVTSMLEHKTFSIKDKCISAKNKLFSQLFIVDFDFFAKITKKPLKSHRGSCIMSLLR